MKKQILLLAAVVASYGAFAQDIKGDNKISFGVKAGLSQASLRGDAVNNLNNLLDVTSGMISSGQKTGIFAGGFVSIPLGSTFTVEPGIYYAQKGYELRGELGIKGAEFLGANARAKLNSHYIDLPVVLKANIGGFQIFAGPQVSYLAKADLNTKAGVLGFNIIDRNIDATEQLNRWDAGVTGGIGYQFGNGVSVTAAYDHGLSKVNAGQNLETYNKAFKVGVGFKF